MSTVAYNVYKIIEERCLSQSAIARKAGYGVRKFNDMLRGRKIITADDIIIIANTLGVKPGELLETDEDKKGA